MNSQNIANAHVQNFTANMQAMMLEMNNDAELLYWECVKITNISLNKDVRPCFVGQLNKTLAIETLLLDTDIKRIVKKAQQIAASKSKPANALCFYNKYIGYVWLIDLQAVTEMFLAKKNLNHLKNGTVMLFDYQIAKYKKTLLYKSLFN